MAVRREEERAVNIALRNAKLIDRTRKCKADGNRIFIPIVPDAVFPEVKP